MVAEPKLPLDLDHSCKRDTGTLIFEGDWEDAPDEVFEEKPIVRWVFGVEAERWCPGCQYERGWRDAHESP